jgi:hypothetical protein
MSRGARDRAGADGSIDGMDSSQSLNQEEANMDATTVAVDLAKDVFREKSRWRIEWDAFSIASD